MLPQVKLIGKSEIDSRSFYGDLRQALGRAVTGPIDKAGADPEKVASLIVATCEMLVPDQNYHKILRNPGSVTKHFFFSFFALSLRSHCSEFSQHTTLGCHCVQAKHSLHLHLLSGTLEQWRTAIINCSSDIVEPDFRKLINCCMFEFEKIGLKDLWFNYSKQTASDDTIRLIEQK